jgi:hypothetical protein
MVVDNRTTQISGLRSQLPQSYCKLVKSITEGTSLAHILLIRETGLSVSFFISICVKCLSVVSVLLLRIDTELGTKKMSSVLS